MKYIEVRLMPSTPQDFIKDLLSAELSDLGYDGFLESDDSYSGYIAKDMFNEKSLKKVLSDFEYDRHITYVVEEMEDKDWNEEWEKNSFQPLVIGNECVIHATFHKNYPDAKYDLVIDPRMAFGTGHHSTTSLMVRAVLACPMEGKSVLDMGCGTAVLAILAAKKGAQRIAAVDIDEWAYNNAQENIHLNNVPQIKLSLGGAELLNGLKFDIILANINRNILLQDIPQYADALNRNGLLFLSGFYETDIPAIMKRCGEFDLIKTDRKSVV